ncbi:MAG: O-antigen ligase family protein [Patescibacteria group bacterium]|nr:O-antigen ligase family protein [Patescibacteria group bacterium]
MIYFIALICFSLPSYLVRFSIFGIPTTLLEILIYIAAIITLILKLKCQSSKLYLKTQNYLLPVFLFLITGIVSIFISPDKKEALGVFKAYIFDPILLYLIILASVKKKKDFGLIINALIVSGIVVAFHAIWQKISGNAAADGRVVGIFGYSPNYLALFLSPLTVLTFSQTIFDRKKIWLYAISSVIMFLAICLSGSRAGIIVVLAGILALFIIKYWPIIKTQKLFILLFYILIALLLFGGWQIVKPNWQASADAGRISSSNNIRWEIWKTTAEDVLIKNNKWILGVGLGNYQNYFTNLTRDRVNYPEWISPMALTPHNIFLTIWVNMGLLGLISFIWILINFFKAMSYKPYVISNGQLKTYSLMLMATMIAIIIQGFVDSPYWKNDLAIMFWIFIALSVIISSNIFYENHE